tara:strand:- start:182 stop:424 length:243 start_codon:yes stop_codon:yes gene_type:complete
MPQKRRKGRGILNLSSRSTRQIERRRDENQRNAHRRRAEPRGDFALAKREKTECQSRAKGSIESQKRWKSIPGNAVQQRI